MKTIAVSIVGRLVVVHRDQPGDQEARRRLEILLQGRVPHRGMIEAWAGTRPDEVCWRRVRLAA